MGHFDKLSPESLPKIPRGTKMRVDLRTARELERERKDFKRDRDGHNNVGINPHWSRITYLAHAGGWVMARRPGCKPFVIPESRWRSFKFWKRS